MSTDHEKRLNHLWTLAQTTLPKIPSLSAFYAARLREETRHSGMSLVGFIDRQLCPKCSLPIVPGETVDVVRGRPRDRRARRRIRGGRRVQGHQEVSVVEEGAFKDGWEESTRRDCRRQVQICRACNHPTILKGPTLMELTSHASSGTSFGRTADPKSQMKPSSIPGSVDDDKRSKQVGKASGSMDVGGLNQRGIKRKISSSSGSSSPAKGDSVADPSKKKKKRKKTTSDLASLLSKSGKEDGKSKQGGMNLNDFLSSL
ncbi:MAG: hypothetical protein DHS80DRAFT_21828 [Piptocephalis tieghemiana]|nr:MAG: hypothetical protein DHS80DRAFT_21828 [Piptocephalis tieghemiana]